MLIVASMVAICTSCKLAVLHLNCDAPMWLYATRDLSSSLANALSMALPSLLLYERNCGPTAVLRHAIALVSIGSVPIGAALYSARYRSDAKQFKDFFFYH